MQEEFTIDYKTQKEWEWLAVLDFFLAGLGAGLFLLGFFTDTLAAAIIGLLATAAGGIALLADLGRPELFWRAILKPGTSWISRGTIIIIIFLVFGALYAAQGISWLSSLPWKGSGFESFSGIIAMIAAIGVMVYTGFLLAYSPAIPSWHNSLVPVMFAAFSLLSATGVMYFLLPFIEGNAGKLRMFEGLGLALLLIALFLVMAYILSLFSSDLAAKKAIRELVTGKLSVTFVVGVLVAGLVIPLAITAFIYLANLSLNSAAPFLAISGILMLAGGFLFRYSLLKAGIYQLLV